MHRVSVGAPLALPAAHRWLRGDTKSDQGLVNVWADGFYRPSDLVAEGDRRHAGVAAVDDVQVRATDSSGEDGDTHFPQPWSTDRNVDDLQTAWTAWTAWQSPKCRHHVATFHGPVQEATVAPLG